MIQDANFLWKKSFFFVMKSTDQIKRNVYATGRKSKSIIVLDDDSKRETRRIGKSTMV